ncbi:glycoside hydrolase family 38 C-terminal domain-containing protein [Bacillus sp. JJ722]|uniref:glycoside hydrolase family 38 N-terminal domain-containing protein n=1 Tax=Bacillus sp. JJ722 TaxID=3122973 RepID=UPI002FFF6D10
MSKVHVVNHTHWDREWYFTTADAIVLSENCFTEVLDELVNNPQAKFCLDGQSSILDDYVQLRPDRIKQIEKFVSQNRLAIGPWYTQTDAFFVNAESIIRNLTVGIRDSKKYGDYMKIGYLPDTFGFNAQMPTILENCGIDNIIFWRGINFNKHVKGPYFKWKGLGEKEIIAVNLVDGYGSASHLKDTNDYLERKLFPNTKKINNLSKQQEVLMTAGGDQLDIINDLPQKLLSINEKTEDQYEVSTYETFMDYLRTQENLDMYEGEFREPCTARVHKSIGSVRYDIKRFNFIIEQKLLNRVEPLIAIARANGINISEKLLHVAWKKILEGHAHDSMGGCVSDDVAIDIIHRMKEANEMADGIENIIVKRLSEQMKLTDKEIIVFNTLPTPYKGYKVVEFMAPSKNIRLKGYEDALLLEAVYYDGKDNLLLETPEGPKYINEDPYYKLKVLINIDLPSMGYRVIDFEDVEPTILELEATKDTNISNKYYRISFSDNELELTTHFGKKIRNFIQFEDSGNDGDTYDYSPLRGDKPELLSLSLDKIEKAPQVEVMTLTGTFHLPYQLSDRLNPEGKRDILSIELMISLTKDTDRIECSCKVDNQIYSHRLRVKINTDVMAKETIASLPFGYIRRPVLNGEPQNWQQEFVECPIDIEPYDASVAVESNQYNISAFGKGIKEYQFIGESLYLTLFATTSQLGKPNLVYRPGRASGDTTKKGHVMIPTPKAELIGINEFEFSFRVAEGQFDEYSAAKCWEEYTIEHISYQPQMLNKFIYRLDNKVQPREKLLSSPLEFSLLEVSEENLYSSLSPSLYDENAFLLRIKNPTKEDRQLLHYDFSQFKRVVKVNYIEDICEDEKYIIPAYDTLTLKLWL